MPAPVPVTIRHDSPTQLGSLARAAGASAFNRQNRLRNYETRLKERLADQQFLNAAANRQLQDTMDRRRVTASLDRGADQGRMLQEARQYAQPQQAGVQTFTGGADDESNAQLAALDAAKNRLDPTQYTAMRALAEGGQLPDSTLSQVLAGVEPESPLVPAPTLGQPQPQQQPLIETRQAGEVPFGPGGDIPEQVRLRRLEQERQQQERPMVTPDVATQLQSLAAMRGQIPEDQFNSLWTLAQSGQLEGNQLIDDVRQAIPGESGRMTATERMLDRNEARRLELERAAQLPPDQQVAWAEAETRSRLGMTSEEARAYIEGQRQLTAPYGQTGGQTGRQAGGIPADLPEGTVNNGDGSFTLPNGKIVEPQ